MEGSRRGYRSFRGCVCGRRTRLHPRRERRVEWRRGGEGGFRRLTSIAQGEEGQQQ